MEVSQLRAALNHVTYKPGWSFRLLVHPHEGMWLRIEARVEDSYSPGATTTLGINCPIPPVKDYDAFYEWLAYRLQRVESHECREWFKVDGKPHADPHEEIDQQLVEIH